MKNEGSTGIGFTSALQLIFIVLKLCKVIDWKWVWVLAPTWTTVLAVVIIGLIVAIVNKRKW